MGHWYDKDGEPRHHEGKNGGDTTLREARKLELYPSVTTIAGVRHKEGLVRWLQEQAALAAGMKAIADGLEGIDIDKSFAWAAIADAREQVEEKSDKGTEIHDLLEKFHDNPFDLTEDEQKLCYAIVDAIKNHTGLSLFDHFTPEARFCDTDLGYAGMCDLHTPVGTKVEEWVLDYKTKDEVTNKTRGYDEQAEQLVAYSHGLGIPQARVANLFIPREPDDEGNYFIKFYEHKNTESAWQRFKHTLMLWQVLKKYGPYYEEVTT
jgi:hypothetical protein